jgi:NAD-dependent dihydropyrimidine dehydrogenase PreA subunit/DNA-binding transcriptional ArsR family regulator
MPRTNKRIQQLLKEPIDPVYRELAEKLKEPKEEIFPRLLGKLMTLEEAKVMNALPASPEDIAKKLKLDKATVEKDLQVLVEKGLLYPGRSGWHLIRSYGALRDAAGASNPKYINDDFVDLTFAYSDKKNNQTIEDIRKGVLKSVRQGMRVVPRWKSIKDIPGLLPYEDVREIYKGREPIVVVPCACKVVDRNRKCKDDVPVDSCVVVGKAAQYNLNRGTGKRITYDEALELLEKFDKLSLVHLVGNSTTMPNMICNCHNCCCGVFYRTSKLKPQVNQIAMAKSRFIATVDPSKCRTCKKCVAMCPIGAAQIKYYAEFGGERAYIDTEECIGCGLCVVSCTAQTRAMKMVRPPAHIPTPDAGAIADAAE